MKFILATKLGMTQVFKEDGTVVPVTRVKTGPCVVTQVKTKKKDGVEAIQIGFGKQKLFRLNKAEQGHLKGMEKDGLTVRVLRDFRANESQELNRGDVFTASIFQPGEKVQVVGTAKGRGFQGVVKRHGFKGTKATHGNKDQLRMPGSIGATGPARVFKGTRMGGHMGDNRVTVKNLEVMEVKVEEEELLIKGAVPGARNGLLLISTQDGKIEISREEESKKVKEEKVENNTEDVKTEDIKVEETKPETKLETKSEEKVEDKVEVKEEIKTEDKKEETKEKVDTKKEESKKEEK